MFLLDLFLYFQNLSAETYFWNKARSVFSLTIEKMHSEAFLQEAILFVKRKHDRLFIIMPFLVQTKINVYFLAIPFLTNARLYCFENKDYSIGGITILLMKNKTLKPNICQNTRFCHYFEEPFNYLSTRRSTFQLGGWHGRTNVTQFITTTVLGPAIRRRQR